MFSIRDLYKSFLLLWVYTYLDLGIISISLNVNYHRCGNFGVLGPSHTVGMLQVCWLFVSFTSSYYTFCYCVRTLPSVGHAADIYQSFCLESPIHFVSSLIEILQVESMYQLLSRYGIRWPSDVSSLMKGWMVALSWPTWKSPSDYLRTKAEWRGQDLSASPPHNSWQGSGILYLYILFWQPPSVTRSFLHQLESKRPLFDLPCFSAFINRRDVARESEREVLVYSVLVLMPTGWSVCLRVFSSCVRMLDIFLVREKSRYFSKSFPFYRIGGILIVSICLLR